MILFEIILVIVVLVVVSSYGRRITSLEARLKALESTEPKPVSKVAPSAAAPIASTPVAAVSSPAPATKIEKPAHSEASSEEASGRILGRIGIAAVILGVVSFLKYAFDNDWIGPNGRVMIGIFIGIILLALGQWLRAKYLRYSDLLMGGGVAVLYLSVYSANSFYGLIGPTTTGVLMFCVTLLTFAISIVNATQTLAAIGIIGGFLTPVLMGSHENNMLGLFGYMTLLNLLVLGISYFKKWPKIIAIAFIGSGLNYMAWASMYYKSIYLPETLTFLFVTFLIFLVASIIRTVTTGTKADGIDYFLLAFNAAGLTVFGYLLLVRDYADILGFASVLVALVYMVVAFLANKYNPQDRALNIFLPGLAVVFLSIAVPMQFDSPWIAVAWFVESLVLYFIASQISNRGFQVMGVIVYILGLLNYFSWVHLDDLRGSSTAFVPILNSAFIIIALAVAVAYFISWIYTKYGSITPAIRDRGIAAFFIIANILTVYGLTHEVTTYYAHQISETQTEYSQKLNDYRRYNSGTNYNGQTDYYQTYSAGIASMQNRSNTAVSIIWALYAALLTAIGFARRVTAARRMGLALFILTGFKVLIDVWSLGQLYRIVSFIAFGVIALAASFAYAKYKDRLKQLV